MTPEGKVTKDVKNRLDGMIHRGAKLWYFKVHGGPAQRAGVPDIVGCYRGLFFAIELKAEKGKTTLKQDIELRLIDIAHGWHCVARTVEEVDDLFGKMDRYADIKERIV